MGAVSLSSIPVRPPPFILLSPLPALLQVLTGQSETHDLGPPSLPLPVVNLRPLQSEGTPLHCLVIGLDANLLLPTSLVLYWYINFSKCREL